MSLVSFGSDELYRYNDEGPPHDWGNLDESDDDSAAPLTVPTKTASEAGLKVVKTWTIDNAALFLSQAGRRETFYFDIEHAAYPNVVWGVTLHPPIDQDELVAIPSSSLLAHFVRFPQTGPAYLACNGRCFTSITAELMRMSKDAQESDEIAAVIGVVKIGRNAMDARNVKYITREAWPLGILQTAAASDGSLHIRLTLEIDFEVERAIRSRDLFRGLLKSGHGSDFTIRVGDERFAVHKAILSIASNDLRDLLSVKDNEDVLDLTEIASSAGVKAFLALVYHDASCEWAASQSDIAVLIGDVLLLAGRFKTSQFMDQIGALVQKSVCVDNVLRILEIACNCDAWNIQAICSDFILENRADAQTPEFVAQLKKLIGNDQLRGALADAVLTRRCCSDSCRCARRRANGEFYEPGDIVSCLPNEPILLSEVWEIPNALSRLTQRGELSCTLCQLSSRFQQFYASASQGLYWKIALQPGSSLRENRHTSFASVSVWLDSVPRTQQEVDDDAEENLSECENCWANVDLCLERAGPCRNEIYSYASGVPFEFKPGGRRVFFVTNAWPMAALYGAICENTLRINVELRLVNLPEFLRCHRILAAAHAADRAMQGPESTAEGAIAKSGADCLKSVQTWIIGDASESLQNEGLSCDVNVAHPAFPGIDLHAALLPRGMHPSIHDYSTITLSAMFNCFSAFCVSRCCVGVSAELVKLSHETLNTGSLHPDEIFPTIELGPAEMIHGSTESVGLSAEAWPFRMLKSAISADNTLRIRFTLTIFNIQQAFGMYQSIRELHRSGRLSDFTITAHGETFVTHKCVLSAASNKLRAIVLDERQGGVLDLTDVAKAAGVEAFLALAYCDIFDWLSQDDVAGVVCDVLALADRFDAEHIKCQIVPAVAKILTVENFVRILDAANKYGALKAKEACFRFLLENCAAVLQNEALMTQLQDCSYGVPEKAKPNHRQHEFSPDGDVICVARATDSSRGHWCSSTSTSVDDASDFQDEGFTEVKHLHRAECDIKGALQVGNYDLSAALRVLVQLKQKVSAGEVNAEVLLRLPTIMETVKKCRKFATSPLIRNTAIECVDLMKQLFEFDAHASDEEWFKNFKMASEKYWRENPKSTAYVRQYIAAVTRKRGASQPAPSEPQIQNDPASAHQQQDSTSAFNSVAIPTMMMDVGAGSSKPVAVSYADQIAAVNVGLSQPMQMPAGPSSNALQQVIPIDCTNNTELMKSGQRVEMVVDKYEAMDLERQSGEAIGTDCDQEIAEKECTILGDFLLAFFQRQLCCSRACDRAASGSQRQTLHSERKTPDPTSDDVFPLEWDIPNDMLDLPSRHFSEFDHPRGYFRYRLKLLPKGDSLSAQHDEYASLALSLVVHWRPELSERPEYFWAAVELNLVSEGLGGVVQGSNLLVPFRFSKNSRKLLLDKAWPTASLRKAVWQSDSTLHIRVKVAMVNIPSVLNCFDLIRDIYETRAFTDFVLACKGETVMVHKSVLAQRSEIFAAMFSSEMREATEKYLDLTSSTTPSALRAFVDAIYFGEVNDVDDETTMEMVKLAHRYELNDLKALCDQQLARIVDMENVIEILSASELYALPLSKAACMRYLGANCLSFLKSPRWRELETQGSFDLMQTLAREAILQMGGFFSDSAESVARR